MVAPLRDTLGRVEGQLHELERVRVAAYTSLTEQVGFSRQASEQLREQTSSLVTALKAPQARGRWGEMQLRRVVEMAGMVEHCDFTEQATVTTADGVLRPDLVVRLAGGKQIVVDAKVSLAAYLQAVESKDDDVTAERMRAHARHLRAHVDGLAAQGLLARVPADTGVRRAVRAGRRVPRAGAGARPDAARARDGASASSSRPRRR